MKTLKELLQRYKYEIIFTLLVLYVIMFSFGVISEILI
jgi:hypothetical protein